MKSLPLKVVNLLALAGIVAGALAIFAAPAPFGLFALDVGQGDSILVRAPNGADLLVDAGPPGGASGRAFAALAPRDRAIGAVALTHQDLDHSGSAADVLGRFGVGEIFAPVWSDKAADILLAAAARGVATGTLQRGDRVWLDRGAPVYLDVLWPPAGPAATDGNDGSMVALLVYGESTAVLTGDAPRGVERMLVAARDPIDADVLKVGHHGSKTASDPTFLSAVSPTFAIVSAGRGNRYGHPAPETISAIRAAGATVLSTVEVGTVSFTWNGRGLAPT